MFRRFSFVWGSETDNSFALVPGSNLSWNTTDETLRDVSVIFVGPMAALHVVSRFRCLTNSVVFEYRRSASLVRF